VSSARHPGPQFRRARMTAHARPAAGRTGRPAAPAGPCRAPSVACARARAARSMPQARARVGARGSRALWLVLLAVLLPQTSANDIDKKAIAQETACADGLNTLTVTLQVTACSPGTHARPPRAASAPRPSPSASLKRPACVPAAAGGKQTVSRLRRIQTSQRQKVCASSVRAAGDGASGHECVTGGRFAARILQAGRRGSECSEQRPGARHPRRQCRQSRVPAVSLPSKDLRNLSRAW